MGKPRFFAFEEFSVNVDFEVECELDCEKLLVLVQSLRHFGLRLVERVRHIAYLLLVGSDLSSVSKMRVRIAVMQWLANRYTRESKV
jgi:hypothetical protein